LDGGCHSVYNFKVKSATDYADLDSTAGIFGKVDKGATVCNLQVGKEGATTEYSFSPWQRNVFMGAITGYCSGEITNCRVVNCTMYAHTAAQEDKFRNYEFASNVGGIAGVVREGVITRCYVTGSNFNSDSWSRYNNISNSARCGGIAGYSDNSSVSDCFIENNVVVSSSETGDSAWGNKVGQPYSQAGGVLGYALNTSVQTVVVYNNTVTVNKTVGAYSNGNGAAYRGCMFGQTNSTTPKSLIGINTALNPSGSNASYPEFTKIAQNSFELLIKTDTAFGNGYCVESSGKISLLFNV
ncbi:MAG: hypothetical protein K2J54_00665, partial [Clostridia bacterium]|nr:hypothetical protein [Clostridia bacterium]